MFPERLRNLAMLILDDAEQARKAETMGEGRNLGLFFDYFANKLDATQKLGDPNLPLERRNAR